MEKRRTYSREFKLAAVRKVIKQGLPYSQVANDLDVHDSLIRSWKKIFEQDGTLAAELSSSSSVEDELKRLREEN